MTARPGPPRSIPVKDAPLDPKKHNHGHMYRRKVVPLAGPPEYGEWFGTEIDVRETMRGFVRNIGARYYCEMKRITCTECDAEEPAKVICAL